MSLMADREKVIKEFELFIKEFHPACTSEGVELDMLKEVLSLLKKQEHGETFIVIDTKTGEEADTYDIALHDEWAQHLCYCDMEGWAIEDDGTLLLVDECGRFEYADRERFKVVWDA